MTEAIMVGMMRRLEAGGKPSVEGVKFALSRLAADTDFVESIAKATADEDNVKTRIARATQALAGA
jgi:hypothetical protein